MAWREGVRSAVSGLAKQAALLGMLLTWPLASSSATASTEDAKKPVDYGRQIKPLLARHCVRCHGPEKQKSELRVDTGKGLLIGGKLGPAVIAGKGEKSPLVEAILGTSNTIVAMPPTGEGDPLSADEAALVKQWIDEGSKFPARE